MRKRIQLPITCIIRSAGAKFAEEKNVVDLTSSGSLFHIVVDPCLNECKPWRVVDLKQGTISHFGIFKGDMTLDIFFFKLYKPRNPRHLLNLQQFFGFVLFP